MRDAVELLLSFLAGLTLGTMFFAGLWWSLRKALASQSPALWIVGSVVVRMSVTITGFYFVFGGDLRRLLACMVGFLVARKGVIWWTKSADQRVDITHVVRHGS